MIDIFNMVYTDLSTQLTADFTNLTVSAVPVLVPEVFPYVTIDEADNYSYAQSRSGTDREGYANVVYEINIYSKDESDKHAQARSIAAKADGLMQDKGFTRISMNPVLDEQDPSYYRLILRYNAVVSADYKIYKK